MNTRNTLIMVALMAVAGWAAAAHAQDDIYVTMRGHTNPVGSPDRPFHSIPAAACRALSWEPSNTVEMEPGNYPQTFTLDTPVTLTTSGGTARIGDFSNRARTTFRLFTANTHLFGNQCNDLLPTWIDETRTSVLFDSGIAPQNPDVVMLQEVWEPAFAQFIVDVARARGYPYVFYGGYIEPDCGFPFPPSCLNSGLLFLSKYPIIDASQVPFTAQTTCSPAGGNEGSATKGFTIAWIVKDGFNIALFNTHTEADADDWRTRQAQVSQLMATVKEVRQTIMPPGSVIFVAGDFNVAGATSHPSLSNCDRTNDWGGSCWEYRDYLVPAASEVPILNDAHRNAPCFYTEPHSALYTASLENVLHRGFSEGIPSELLDYVFYSRLPSDSTVLSHVVPVSTRVHRMQHSTELCGPICDPTCGEDICTRELSDHWGLVSDFDIVGPIQ